MKKTLFITLLMYCFGGILAQDTDSNWEPQLHTTGYITTIAEYTDLESFVEAKKDIGIGLSEAGFLGSYKPLEKLELKTTLVYSHSVIDIQSLLVETYGIYTFNQKLKLGAGKFLTPLSPINQYFYAPLNPSGVLPMVVSHHFLTPQSISGMQVNGKFGENNFQLGYNLTYGTYTSVGHIKSGIIKIMGQEDIGSPELENDKPVYFLGGSGRIYADYNRVFKIGLNVFGGTRASQAYSSAGVVDFLDSRRRSYGVDAHLNLLEDKLKINGEYWFATNEGIDYDTRYEYTGYYAEILFNTGKLTPFMRYEYVNDVKIPVYAQFPDNKLFNYEGETSSLGAGLAYRPFYEILLKFDWRMLETTTKREFEEGIPQQMQDGINAQSPITSPLEYNHFLFSAVFSF